MGSSVTRDNIILKEIVQNNGEITVNLVLTIKLESGSAGMAKETSVEDQVDYMIPEIEKLNLIEFGRKV